MKIKLPAGVKTVLDNLTARGYEAYAVGGCVRDSILYRQPDDWDITTSASPEQIKEIFARTVDTGIQHGTVTVLLGGNGYEVTTYRIDGEYEDGRHPKDVCFTASLAEDLKRRDFTINAMAYNETDGLVDLFGGMRDLQQKVIRCVGDANERFSEDALRILRAVRFSAQLGFKIAGDTVEALVALAPTLKKISAERITAELTKLLLSDRPEYLRAAWETGITKVVLPEFDWLMKKSCPEPPFMTKGEHSLYSVKAAPKNKALRYALLLHHLEEDTAEAILRRMKLDNDTIRTAMRLIRYVELDIPEDIRSVRFAVCEVGEELFPFLLQMKLADFCALDEKKLPGRSAYVEGLEKLRRQIAEENQCVSLTTLAISGKDLLELGCPRGPGIGEILNQALLLVLNDPANNKKENLLAFAKEQIG